jgi:Ca2+-binding EF-hand superfamily protein
MRHLLISALLLSGLMAGGQGLNQPSFSFYDADADGMITKTEYEMGHQKRTDQMKGDGKMMKNQANAPAFEGIDTDSDGMISPEEFSVHQAEQRGQ